MHEKEKELLELTTDLWNKYIELPGYDPMRREVESAIHIIQGAIATKIVRKIYPEIWK